MILDYIQMIFLISYFYITSLKKNVSTVDKYCTRCVQNYLETVHSLLVTYS